MDFTLHIWRQKPGQKGRMVRYQISEVSEDMSFLEMLDLLNEKLQTAGEEPIAFDHDCREGICGMCSLVINGIAHGPQRATTTCQLHMRSFKPGAEIYIEPFRAKAFPVIKDLVVDRGAFDRIVVAGGFISANTGAAPDAHDQLVPRQAAVDSLDAAQCIACGACVAACKNASAMLFMAAKIGHLRHLPQGQPERRKRALAMVEQADAEGFGSCTNYEECEAVCPKQISVRFIGEMNRDYLVSAMADRTYGSEAPAGK